MIALLLALALSNMPPPPPDTCKNTGVGTACRTPRRTPGVCVKAECPKTEVGPAGAKTVKVECLVCITPPADAGAQP